MKTTLFEKYVESGQMTMRELAKRLGYTPEYLSLIRHEHFPITGNFIVRVCRVLGYDIDDLFFNSVPKQTGGVQGGDGDNA